jgi:hypothetical protein
MILLEKMKTYRFSVIEELRIFMHLLESNVTKISGGANIVQSYARSTNPLTNGLQILWAT